MLLYELMSLGDDNVLGRLIDDAQKTLKKLQNNSDKEVCSLACGLLATLNRLEANPNILQVDGYTLMNFLKMLSNTNVDKRTLRMVSDGLGSYSDDDSSD